MIRSSILFALIVGFVALPFTFGGEPSSRVVVSTSPTVAAPLPHCQVPCGIYGDQMRFEAMLEDTKTIAKAITSINEFAANVGADGGLSGKAINQNVRWVTTKEDHATKIQDVMGQYFFAQRIKSDHKEYQGQLATAHRIIVAAMKCKQDSDPATAVALEKAILEFYEAYEGKKPSFHKEEKK